MWCVFFCGGGGGVVIVDGEIANGDVAGAGDRQRRSPRGADQLRAVAIELETVKRLEGERAIDPVGGVLAEIEDDMNRAAGLGRISCRLGNRGDGLGESRVGVAAGT